MDLNNHQKISVCQSHTGLVRGHNEDSLFCNDTLGLWIVADGMGGHLAGECASHITVETIATGICNNSSTSLATAIEIAHKAVLQAAQNDSNMTGMGSTVVAARLNEDKLDVAWVGDSRAYLWNGTKLHRISRDHSVVQDFIDRGALTEDEAMTSPNRGMITQAVGPALNNPLKVAAVSLPVYRGQKVMLCSDGLTDLVTDHVITGIFSATNNIEKVASQLIHAALDAGGSDNITVICLELGDLLPLPSYFKIRRQRLLISKR